MAGGKGPPYRAPCGGWKDSLPYLGGCENHWRREEAVVVDRIRVLQGGSGYTTATVTIAEPNPGNPEYGQRAEAVAEIRDGSIFAIHIINGGWGYTAPPQVTIQGDGTGAAAEAILAGPKLLLNTACDPVCPPLGPGDPADPETCTGDRVYADKNCYEERDVWIDLSRCVKKGWKAFAVSKVWHGRFGFMQNTDPNATVSTRYLAIRRYIRNSGYRRSGDPQQEETWSAEASMSASVSPLSGRITQTSHQWEQTTSGGILDWATELPGYTYADGLVRWANADAGNGIITMQVYPESSAMSMTPAEWKEWLETPGNLVADENAVSASVGLSDTLLTIRVTIDIADGSYEYHEEIEVEVELSSPLSLGETMRDLLAVGYRWALSDDIQHRWRQDNNCHVVPLVRWHEYNQSRSPDIGLWTEPFEGDDGPNGELIGDPLPTSRVQTGQRWVPFVHWQWRDMYGQDPPGIMGSLGWVPLNTGLPRATTFWVDREMVHDIPFGAGAGFVYIEPNGRIEVQVYAEIFHHVPSHNWARPCGPDRFRIDTRDQSYWQKYGPGIDFCRSQDDPETYPPLYLFRDENNNPIAPPICGRIPVRAIEEVDSNHRRLVLGPHDPSHTLQAGDVIIVSGITGLDGQHAVVAIDSGVIIASTWQGEYGGGGYISSPGAAHWQWNDDQPKGEYVVMRWRDDNDAAEVISECQTHCVQRNPCCPAIIVADPMGILTPETTRCVLATHTTDGFPMARVGRPTIRVVALALRHPDPLWVPDPEDILCIGGGKIYLGDPPPMVEARCNPPSGAPALPAGFIYGGEEDGWYSPPAPDACWHGEIY